MREVQGQLAYDKWIREQVEGILGLPEFYRQLPGLLEIEQLESRALVRKAEDLHGLLVTEVECHL